MVFVEMLRRWWRRGVFGRVGDWRRDFGGEFVGGEMKRARPIEEREVDISGVRFLGVGVFVK